LTIWLSASRLVDDRSAGQRALQLLDSVLGLQQDPRVMDRHGRGSGELCAHRHGMFGECVAAV
jgi:hypothetical protein